MVAILFLKRRQIINIIYNLFFFFFLFFQIKVYLSPPVFNVIQWSHLKKSMLHFKMPYIPFKSLTSLLFTMHTVGPKDLGTLSHFISSPRPMPRRKKCQRTNKGNPNYQDILPRTTLSSADQNHRRGKRHFARGSPLEHPKGSSEPNVSGIGAW